MLTYLSSVIPLSHVWLLKHSLQSANPKTILDVGCGDGSLMSFLMNNHNWVVDGIEIHQKSLNMAKKRQIYNSLIRQKALTACNDLVKKHKKYDVVFCSEVLEHIEKKDAYRMLTLFNKLARKKIIVGTPQGFSPQPDDAITDNKYQRHISVWNYKEFQKKGFAVHGVGLRYLWELTEWSGKSSKLLILIASLMSLVISPIVYVNPSHAAGLVCTKTIKK